MADSIDPAQWRETWAKQNLGPMIGTHPLLLYQAGLILYGRGEKLAAEGAFREVLDREPGHVEALRWLTVLLQHRQEPAAAHDFRRRRVVAEMERLGLRDEDLELAVGFQMAAEEDVPPPRRAPTAYLAAFFDDFAENYDDHLCNVLHYRGPELLADAVRNGLAGATAAGLDVLDAGCGTGLAGPHFRPLARRLDGVDLSLNMLARAQQRGPYDDLRLGELTEAMTDRPAGYDLVVAADVLIYQGDLAPVCAAVARTLRPGGLFACTIEEFPGQAYVLQTSAHYAHAPGYLRDLLARSGLDAVTLAPATLRYHREQPVRGHVVVARRAADA